MKNFVVWFEIPVKDLSRAMKFYSKVMAVEMQPMEMGPRRMAFFPMAPGIASGALLEGKENSPGEKGTLVYLNGGDDLAVPLKRVEAAGGKVLQDKMSIGEHGFIATFKDTEGNRVALHSMK
jgi:predicted enzyme related to lactoylglutathione lyase